MYQDVGIADQQKAGKQGRDNSLFSCFSSTFCWQCESILWTILLTEFMHLQTHLMTEVCHVSKHHLPVPLACERSSVFDTTGLCGDDVMIKLPPLT